MKSKLIIFLLLLNVSAFGQDLSAEASKTADKFAKRLVKALKTEKVSKVMPFFYDIDDVKLFMENAPGGALMENTEEIWEVFESNKKKNIEQTLELGKKHNIVWKKVKLVEISYREVMLHERTNGIEGVFKLYMEYKGEEFVLLLSPCLFLNGEWNLADFILFEEHDHH